jgi:plastocyanin
MGIRALPTVAASLLIAVAIVAVPAAAGAESVPHDVEIRFGSDCPSTAFCFAPSALTIADGDKVTWKDLTPEAHTVTPCTPAACNGIDGGTGADASFTGGSVIPPGYFNPPRSYSHVFHGAGTYNYYCSIHGYSVMQGTVTVMATPPSTTSPPTTTIAVPVTTAAGTTATTAIAPTTISARVATPVTPTGPVLARTGSTQHPFLFASVALIGLGSLGAVAGRRRRHDGGSADSPRLNSRR